MTLLALIDAEAGSTPVLGELLRTWSFPLAPLVSLSLALAIYLRGWSVARRTRPIELPLWRAGCFVSGVIALWIALASPIDALDDYLLAAHMIQHFILMSVAPPLIVLGAPVIPMLRGLPRVVIRGFRPLFRAQWIRVALRAITHPVFAWIAMNVAYLGWHVPAMFDLTFRAEWIHDCEHLCFFVTSLAFWWVVLEPWPAHGRWPRWAMIPYLLGADVLNTVLSATLSFAGRVLYPSYAEAPRICFLSPLKDQVAAGAEMWVLNSLVMLAPAVLIAMKELSPKALVDEVVAR
jgi:cytochrome c oxidase assembly factor CtaG